MSFSRCSQALVEAYYPCDEITVSGWVTEGDLTILPFRKDKSSFPASRSIRVQAAVGSFLSAKHMDQYEEIASISQGVASAFELKEGPFYLQLLIGEEGIKSFILFSVVRDTNGTPNSPLLEKELVMSCKIHLWIL